MRHLSLFLVLTGSAKFEVNICSIVVFVLLHKNTQFLCAIVGPTVGNGSPTACLIVSALTNSSSLRQFSGPARCNCSNNPPWKEDLQKTQSVLQWLFTNNLLYFFILFFPQGFRLGVFLQHHFTTKVMSRHFTQKIDRFSAVQFSFIIYRFHHL